MSKRFHTFSLFVVLSSTSLLFGDRVASPTALGTALSGVKDAVTPNSYASLGVLVSAGQTLVVRVYPYNTGGAASGKTLMLANVVISGVTN